LVKKLSKYDIKTTPNYPVKKYEILIKSDYKSGMRYFFDFSCIAAFNGYWRIAVAFKM